MQVTKKEEKGLYRKLEVKVPASDIQKQRETRLKEVGKTVRLPGFRPGKAPMSILEKRYGRAVMGEVLEAVVNQTSAQALQDNNLRPAMQPKIEVTEFDEGTDLTYSMELDVMPEIKVMDLKGLKLEKPVAKVTDKEIDDSLEKIAGNNKGSRKIESDRKSKKDDILLIAFQGRTKDDGVEHDGMQGHGHRLKLGSGQFIPGFEDQLIGQKAGEKVEVTVTFPENYGAEELAGREAIFDVEIKEIHEETDAEINDDFAKSLGIENVDALRTAVREQLEKEYDGLSRLKAKRQLLDILDENHQFDVPEMMLDQEYDLIVKQIEQERQAAPEGEQEVTEEEREELKSIAERRVRLGLVMAEIGNEVKISISDQELQRAVINEAQKYPGQEKAVFDFYAKNRQALESLKAPLFEEKVTDHIFDLAEISEKEVSLEELSNQEEEEVGAARKKPAKKAAKKAAKKTPAKKSATKKSAKKKT